MTSRTIPWALGKGLRYGPFSMSVVVAFDLAPEQECLFLESVCLHAWSSVEVGGAPAAKSGTVCHTFQNLSLASLKFVGLQLHAFSFVVKEHLQEEHTWDLLLRLLSHRMGTKFAFRFE